MDVEVVGLLDAAHHLLHLIIKVPAPLLRHHEVVLHRDGQTVPRGVGRELLAALRERARGGLVGHAAGQPLIVRKHPPRDFIVGPVKVHIRQDQRGEGRPGGARDEPIDPILDVDLPPLQLHRQLREMHAARAPVAVLVVVDIERRGPPDGRPVGRGGHIAGAGPRDRIEGRAARHPVPLQQHGGIGPGEKRRHPMIRIRIRRRMEEEENGNNNRRAPPKKERRRKRRGTRTRTRGGSASRSSSAAGRAAFYRCICKSSFSHRLRRIQPSSSARCRPSPYHIIIITIIIIAGPRRGGGGDGDHAGGGGEAGG